MSRDFGTAEGEDLGDTEAVTFVVGLGSNAASSRGSDSIELRQ